ncbi:DUF4178 domain-containing protein [Ramlibacter sp. XY19]|uniref:DUF4178 domain-containing protein n=1 Tax=Ramlibacter paludis TaxID=2908000 RepID=UPI0023DB2C24|nr:DUF4178 domain-containing protein [Ramlibacter paludis]MCG2594680.1 DUF4178 domain-containing protein [Ramlibacter paludis]
MATTPQRTYVAPCPGCGAPVEFRSAQSAFAVCSYCRSTVVRDGETLSRIGKMAEVFEDFSPLQLMARGRWQGRDFTLVGRLQYRGASGAWTEWHALFADGSSAWLAEDNGAYVMAVPASAGRPLPQPQQLRLDATTAIDGHPYKVSSNEQVALVSAQGELPKLPPLDQPFAMVELRSADNEVLAIDYGSTPPALSRGRPVALEELLLTGLREDGGKALQGRSFACPNCGATVEVQFGNSKSITCRACNTLIDLQQGVGGELAHALQDEPVQPLIPLGSVGQLQGVQWQVVGYQHRLGTEPDDPDEHFGWDEYLLYNAKRGFTFLVDSTEGWSLVKPATGAPTVSSGRKQATYLGTTYDLKYSYKAQTTYVAGEFYWPVVRGQTSLNRDYAKGQGLLAMEETPTEVTWSVGSQVAADAVAKAFGLEAKKDLLQRGDSGPTTPKSSGTGCGCATIVLVILVILILLALLKACEDDDRNSGSGYSTSSPRSSTGTWGGGGGGSHK